MLIAMLLVLGVVLVLMLPELSELARIHLSPGLGVKDSALISFFVSVVLLVVLALFSGDGLIGEIQFMIPGFFLFFVLNWLLIAWVF
ncbi:MAG: hypothetical protein N0C86_12440 [Candidatus Thiodiazotropha taylori]|nr:hypothetical protein [Candidatus Thiodiazotropha taylori]MCW4326795.1 hypothetical protein [Candidatus Thiodiazotropha taylori]